jgi:hypothetical protein
MISVIPDLTDDYTSPPMEDSVIPLCTLRYFPQNLNDTMTWAFDFFGGLFTKQSESTVVHEIAGPPPTLTPEKIWP